MFESSTGWVCGAPVWPLSIRGTALPLLLDLARKPNFLHDSSVPTLDNLLDGTRGPNAPHPFYLTDPGQRADMVEFLRELSTSGP